MSPREVGHNIYILALQVLALPRGPTPSPRPCPLSSAHSLPCLSSAALQAQQTAAASAEAGEAHPGGGGRGHLVHGTTAVRAGGWHDGTVSVEERLWPEGRKEASVGMWDEQKAGSSHRKLLSPGASLELRELGPELAGVRGWPLQLAWWCKPDTEVEARPWIWSIPARPWAGLKGCQRLCSSWWACFGMAAGLTQCPPPPAQPQQQAAVPDAQVLATRPGGGGRPSGLL